MVECEKRVGEYNMSFFEFLFNRKSNIDITEKKNLNQGEKFENELLDKYGRSRYFNFT